MFVDIDFQLFQRVLTLQVTGLIGTTGLDAPSHAEGGRGQGPGPNVIKLFSSII